MRSEWPSLCASTLPVCSAVSEIPQYSQLVLNVCETLQEEVIALFDQTRHSLASGSAAEDKDSMETDDCPRPRHKDQRDGVREGGNLRNPEPRGLRALREALGEAWLPAMSALSGRHRGPGRLDHEECERFQVSIFCVSPGWCEQSKVRAGWAALEGRHRLLNLRTQEEVTDTVWNSLSFGGGRTEEGFSITALASWDLLYGPG